MQHGARPPRAMLHRLDIANIRRFDGDAFGVAGLEPIGVFLGAGARQIVEHQHVLAALRQRVGEVAAEEPAASSDQHPRAPQSRTGGAHATSPRLSSSAVARSTPSSAA